MENKINIAELLKDCPKGMELDCVMFENPVKYDGYGDTDNYPITILTEEGEHFYLTNEGYMYDRINSKCVIFPKGKTTWEGFQRPFKDGDILTTISEGIIFIHREISNHDYYGSYVSYARYNLYPYYKWYGKDCCRLATEEEKQTLFQAIKDNGYKWNAETKTLEKLVEPKFKVGDKITKIDGSRKGEIYYTDVDKYHVYVGNYTGIDVFFEDQDNWELVPNKFDITTLKPFDKVLVRKDVYGKWGINFFGFYNYDEGYYYTTGNWIYKQCIPYEGNEYLLGTTNDCDNFYKTW